MGNLQCGSLIRNRTRGLAHCSESEANTHDDRKRQASAVVIDLVQSRPDELIHLSEPGNTSQAKLSVEVHFVAIGNSTPKLIPQVNAAVES